MTAHVQQIIEFGQRRADNMTERALELTIVYRFGKGGWRKAENWKRVRRERDRKGRGAAKDLELKDAMKIMKRAR